jgi:hypothetical protein
MSEQLSKKPERPASAPRASKRGTLGRVYILIGATVVLVVASLVLVRLSLPFLPGFAASSTQTIEGFDPRTATFTVRDAATQQCRQVTFRNDTTELVETSFRCDGRPSANAATSSASRLGVLRKAFTPQ